MTPDEPRAPAVQRRRGGWGRRAGLGLLGGLVALVVAFGICEWAGWPFLAEPAQRLLANALQRKVSLSGADGEKARLQVHLLGGLRVNAPYLEIGAPAWSTAPNMLVARDASLKLAYTDLWNAYRGKALYVKLLRAHSADITVERLADGRASWQFGKPKNPGAEPTPLPRFGRLEIDGGKLRYSDEPIAADVTAQFSLRDGRSGVAATAPGASVASATAASSPSTANQLIVDATGKWRNYPLKANLKSIGVLPLVADDAAAVAVPLHLAGTLGGARMSFDGNVTDVLRLARLQGRFALGGPSLAAVGDPLGVTLPTTSAFRIGGLISREGKVWRTVIESAVVGSSQLNGAFTYDARPARPLLAGRLGGSKLMLVDLGPAIGGRDRSAGAPVPKPVAARQGRVLPDRPFDLPALRAMNANVLVDIATVDLNSSWLEPLEPLRGHLVLDEGVLRLSDLDARTAQGRLAGMVQLDGREARALWTTDLNWQDVRLERFIKQARADNAPPFIAGRLRGQAKLAGQGKSTADILSSLRGNVRTQLRDGRVSHLVVEAAGIDVAQALGMLFKGDDALPVQCGVADLAVQDGRLTPRVMVIDTADSAVWVDGSLSLADETFDLRAIVSPKDFSPLTLRTPLRVRGSFEKPAVSLEKGPLGRTIGASLLLGIINPLAALIPLIDMPQPDAAKRGAAGCENLVSRGQAARAQAPGSARK